MGFWEMGNYIAADPGGKVASLNLARDVAHRRADDAKQCECLAAWDDTRECICDKTVEMPLSTERLKEADRLVRLIEACDGRRAKLEKVKSDKVTCRACVGEFTRYTRVTADGYSTYYDGEGNDYGENWVDVELPKRLLLAALADERAKLMTSLQETGIISVDRPNIKAVPK